MALPCGHAAPADGCVWCRLAVRAGVKPGARPAAAKAAPRPAKPAAPARPARCASLGERLELRAGCSGWNCQHACTSTRADVAAHLGGILKAAPGIECQDCPGHPTGGA